MVEDFKQKIAGDIAMSSEPGAAIRRWREEFGVSQQVLAEEVGVTHSVISDYESGRRKSPGVTVVKRIVEAFLEIDRRNGYPVMSRYSPDLKLDCIIAMGEFDKGIEIPDMVEAIGGTILNPDGYRNRLIRGFTVVDSLKAVLSLGCDDYLKIYGWNIDRALVFTDVHYGRSPMIAIRAHPLTPGMVVYHRPDQTDALAIKLAKLEGIPLVTTQITIEGLIAKLNAMKE
ncbi:MAG: helix-turn-helix domain-containing protein [Candidatus Methanomethylophilaceae archaeon]|nr:helix-turn-helix domain-containing protein [Candidatus Methanomethylophilaceae archaeon]